jgi:mitochondrial fission protein ELM1
MTFPRIWVMPGNRPGDDAQVYALAEELGLPFETRKLKFNWLAWLDGKLIRSTPISVKRKVRNLTLVPPWPDLIIHVGRRAVPVAQWVRKQSGGRTRLVFIGHPRVPPEMFDLVYTTRQYRTPTGASMRLLPIAMSRYREPPTTSARERSWLDSLPRPHFLLMLGGDTRHWRMRPSHIAAMAEKLAARASEQGGSLIVARSARTGEAALDAIERRLAAAQCEWRVVRQEFPRFAVLLDDADKVFPTADSISMISEGAITGKPVGIVPLEKSFAGRVALGDQVSESSTMRDLRRFWNFVLAKRMAGTMDQPRASGIANPVVAAASEVRELLESSFGRLPR